MPRIHHHSPSQLVSPTVIQTPSPAQYNALFASYRMVARHRNTTLVTMLTAARAHALQQLVHLHSLPQSLHTWLHNSVDGFVQGLLTYVHESVTLLDSFDPAASLASAAPLLPGMPRLRAHAFLSTASYRNSTLLTLAVRGHEAVASTYAAVVNAMRADVAVEHKLSVRTAVRLVHGVALAVSTYLKRTSEVVKRFVAAAEQRPLLPPENTTRTLHAITQVALEAMDAFN